MQRPPLNRRRHRLLPAVLVLAAGCQCGTKPVPDQASSAFQMNRDSLPFPNFVSGYEASALDTASLQRMFGDGVCEPGSTPCQLTSAARTFMEQANDSMSGGRCEGFAVLSDLMASKKVDVTSFGAATARGLTLEDNAPLQRELAYWFATQLVSDAVGSKTKTFMAKDVLPVIADSLEPGATEHFRIGIVRKQGKSLSGGHSLTPIGFFRDQQNPAVYWLRVYDNNHPDVERLMKLDVVKNRWEFEASANPDAPSRLYFGDASNNNPLYLAPVFSRQGVLPCPFCEGGGSQITTSGGAQATVTTPGGQVGVTDGALTAAPGTSITPSFSDPNDAEATSFVIGLGRDVMSAMNAEVVVQLTSPGDPENPDALQSVGVLKKNVFTAARGLKVTATDSFTATNEGGSYTNASRSPLELLTRMPTQMGEFTLTAFVNGGSDSVAAKVDPANGKVTLQLSGAMGTPIAVVVQGRSPSGDTKSAQFSFMGAGSATLQAETSGWMQGGALTGTLENGGTMMTVSNACTDGLKSGMEPDVDCGSVCNVGCGLGQACASDADCGSGLCHPTQRVCISDACQDTRQSPGETAIDCGGPCAPCAVGLACRASRDCAMPALNDCVSNLCQRVYSIGAAVSFPTDLSAGSGLELVLASGADQLTIGASGSYTFSSRTTGPYAVSIVRQPQLASCTVMNGTGTATADVFVTVSCTRRFAIGGTVTGLPAQESLTLSNNGGSPLTVSQDGAFVFPLQPAGAYAVTVATQPMTATCVVTNGSGAAPATDVTDILVECSTAPSYTVGGTLLGLGAGKTVVLDNDGDTLTRSANGAFTFTNRVSGSYTVTVATQPMGQRCTVTNGTGTATTNVTTVSVSCVDLFTLGGTLSGLGAGKTIVLDNAGDQLSLTANGAFQFTNGVAGPYAVTIATQPMGQTCVVQNGSGTATTNVTTVTVSCPGAPGLDPSFGAGGFLRVAQTTGLDGWQDLVVNADDSIVAVGTSEVVAASAQWIVSKVTPTGAIDTTFGVNGHRLITTGTGQEEARAVVRDSSGRYLVAGSLQGTSSLDLAVARLTSAGALDTTFGTNGIARFDFGADEVADGLTIDAAGRIVVVGSQGIVGGDLLVARLTAAGALDMTFATNGRYLPATTAFDDLNDVVTDASNAVFAVGGRDGDSLVLKLTALGAPDMTFGTAGVATFDLTTGLFNDSLEAVVLDGTRLVAAGSCLDSGASNFCVAAFTSAGALDTSFGAGGSTIVGGATPNETFTDLTPRPGGGFYACGSSDSSAAVMAFTATGAQDMSFSSGQFTSTLSGTAALFGVAVDSIGRVVVAGSVTASGGSGDLGIARINP